MSILLAILIGVLLSVVTVIGDSLVKKASLGASFPGMGLLILGAIVYGLTAFGWFFVMRRLKLSTVGVLYSVSTAVLLVLISVFYFKEKISLPEIIAIFLAIVSLIILARFN